MEYNGGVWKKARPRTSIEINKTPIPKVTRISQ